MRNFSKLAREEELINQQFTHTTVRHQVALGHLPVYQSCSRSCSVRQLLSPAMPALKLLDFPIPRSKVHLASLVGHIDKPWEECSKLSCSKPLARPLLNFQ